MSPCSQARIAPPAVGSHGDLVLIAECRGNDYPAQGPLRIPGRVHTLREDTRRAGSAVSPRDDRAPGAVRHDYQAALFGCLRADRDPVVRPLQDRVHVDALYVDVVFGKAVAVIQPGNDGAPGAVRDGHRCELGGSHRVEDNPVRRPQRRARCVHAPGKNAGPSISEILPRDDGAPATVENNRGRLLIVGRRTNRHAVVLPLGVRDERGRCNQKRRTETKDGKTAGHGKPPDRSRRKRTQKFVEPAGASGYRWTVLSLEGRIIPELQPRLKRLVN
jgi:hypothetical protein